ncbi:sensor histidine kinase [Geodermatophilus sp. TF02-6]|uniref:sensor histidine kinase n=1 Tax=Geodermatophilus sp. TF02-6 TaxID=2250575 RepID=UPI0011BFB5A1|nr:histidine kinase [Geodermatophilus sp. TF02-6]
MQGLGALSRWQAQHPRLVDAGLAVLVFGASLTGLFGDDGPRGGFGGGGRFADRDVLEPVTVTLVAVAAAALVVRRSNPLLVWGVGLAATVLVVLHSGQPTAALVVSVVALYTVGERCSVATTALIAVVTAAVDLVALALAQGEIRDHALSLPGFCVAAAAVGVAVRSQRAAVEAAEARARQAEVTREEEAVRRVTDERLRIARELHDVVAHHISVINVQAGVARHLLTRSPEQAGTALGLVREASRTVLAEMSTVLGLLRTGEDENPTAPPAPGLDQLPALVQTTRAAGLQTALRVTGEPRPLPELADLAAYRVVQESLTNALKYGTGSAELSVEHLPDAVAVEVRNPVAPEPAGAAGSGHGLLGMRERVTSLGGTFCAAATDGVFVVHAEIPRSGS